jgi:hypothetical protein
MAGKSYTASPLNTAQGSLPRGTNNTGTAGRLVINNVGLPGPHQVGSKPKAVSGQRYVSSPLVPKK